MASTNALSCSTSSLDERTQNSLVFAHTLSVRKASESKSGEVRSHLPFEVGALCFIGVPLYRFLDIIYSCSCRLGLSATAMTLGIIRVVRHCNQSPGLSALLRDLRVSGVALWRLAAGPSSIIGRVRPNDVGKRPCTGIPDVHPTTQVRQTVVPVGAA